MGGSCLSQIQWINKAMFFGAFNSVCGFSGTGRPGRDTGAGPDWGLNLSNAHIPVAQRTKRVMQEYIIFPQQRGVVTAGSSFYPRAGSCRRTRFAGVTVVLWARLG